ncbi:hypothetical protein L1987_65629 [Smallanthus sonchifolius]|uniref:Uncharacterized protein n=1 Tax=Smallanthus sonchifolius TaxID=185202 RepID=A0ACB9BUX3_9ASTR|nr:hypothetical protein L1987_65629 [Smallanthus sonchifolius]
MKMPTARSRVTGKRKKGNASTSRAQEVELDPAQAPKWGSKIALSSFEKHWQVYHYNKKMEVIKNPEMLRTPGGNSPRTSKLKGTVNGVEVVMSFEVLSSLDRFDAGIKPEGEYYYPSDDYILCNDMESKGEWTNMIEELFEGDHVKIRNYEIRVLFALTTGRINLSFRQLIMVNIWESRESALKKSIPHAHLISHMLEKAHVIPRTSMPKIVRFKRTVFNDLLEFKETVQSFILKENVGV